jgi:protein SCO1/2
MQESATACPAPVPPTSRLLQIGAYGSWVLCFFLLGFFLPPLLENNNLPTPDLERVKLPRPEPLMEFSLEEAGEGANTGMYTRARLTGQWTLLYFGYTNCPNVCSSAVEVLAEVSKKRNAAPNPAARTALVFVTLDSSRDTPAALRRFLGRTEAEFTALRGSEKQIARLAQQLGILHTLGPVDVQGGYLIDHPATILLIDPSAELRAGFAMPRDANQIIELMSEIETDYLAAKKG